MIGNRTRGQPKRRQNMSKLIQMRQRIKAIETIKKITHAMRLISMSAHSQLKNKQDPLTHYMKQFSALFTKVQASAPDWTNQIINPQNIPANRLIILVGSQKGLCGSFNALLFQFFNQHIEKELPKMDTRMIAIGKKAVDFAQEIKQYPLLATYEKFTTSNLFSIAQELITTITEKPLYTSVLVFSNQFQSFFIQKPQVSSLIPFAPQEQLQADAAAPVEGYLWEHPPRELLDSLVPQYLESRMQYLLFQSLLAEHAARFLSMDNSTRNANNLLEGTQLEYNKLRQAKITKELTELAGSFD